jgi:DNA-binding transcriptional LysR family regulator
VVLPLPSSSPALSTVELVREDLVVISSPAAPAPPAPLRIADLAGEPLVMFRHGYDLRDLTVAACRAEGFEPSFTVEGGEMDAVLGFVRAGLGAAVVPAMVAEGAGGGLRVTPLAGPGLRRTIGLAHRSDVAPPRAARELQRVLLDSRAVRRRQTVSASTRE